MATIQDYLNSIMKAVYGKDVRRSIHDAIKQCYEDATGNPESVAGVVQNMEDMSERMNTLEDIYAAKGIVQQANIIDLPDDVFAKPNFEESGVYYVNKSLDNVIVKPAILCFGAYYLFPYTINIDGGTADLPTITGTGVTAVEFRRQWRYSNTNIPTDVTVRVAELGTQYTDYKGEKVTAIGGAGYSSAAKISGYNGMIFFCFRGTRQDGVTVNGTVNQRLIPCCCTVAANSSEVGEIRELTLTIDGAIGQFDLSRLGYTNYNSYYTTVAPKIVNSIWYWAQPVPDGIAVFSSSDAINWTYKYTIETLFEPYYEVDMAVSGTTCIFAVRTDYDQMKMYLVYARLSDGKVLKTYWIDDAGSRPCIMAWNSTIGYLLAHTIGSNRETGEVLLIIPCRDYGLDFYRWFTTFNSMSYYPVLFSPNSTNNNAQIAMAGMNGMHTNKKGMCFCPNINNADGKEVSPSTAVYPAVSEVITEEGE